MSFEITPKAERFMRMMVMTDGGPGAGFRLFVPAESRILLEGVTIDFVDSVADTRLVFHDPKATSCAH